MVRAAASAGNSGSSPRGGGLRSTRLAGEKRGATDCGASLATGTREPLPFVRVRRWVPPGSSATAGMRRAYWPRETGVLVRRRQALAPRGPDLADVPPCRSPVGDAGHGPVCLPPLRPLPTLLVATAWGPCSPWRRAAGCGIVGVRRDGPAGEGPTGGADGRPERASRFPGSRN